jgi:hypothetical protein
MRPEYVWCSTVSIIAKLNIKMAKDKSFIYKGILILFQIALTIHH